MYFRVRLMEIILFIYQDRKIKYRFQFVLIGYQNRKYKSSAFISDMRFYLVCSLSFNIYSLGQRLLNFGVLKDYLGTYEYFKVWRVNLEEGQGPGVCYLSKLAAHQDSVVSVPHAMFEKHCSRYCAKWLRLKKIHSFSCLRKCVH